ncbi:hypothetical protein SAMN00790413_06070 [Deinococcus hopiensis KR-140]|uniref:Nucleotidyltransferase domain-containing protein n=1 Tax=Deinococcus hopiensis KR-140 TaxID=695939 RepID=A0A1W1VXH0_9DEIO|nr:hypothetical protein SAMN00790413_06070 [Deinococcus hopiensis KR-140]
MTSAQHAFTEHAVQRLARDERVAAVLIAASLRHGGDAFSDVDLVLVWLDDAYPETVEERCCVVRTLGDMPADPPVRQTAASRRPEVHSSLGRLPDRRITRGVRALAGAPLASGCRRKMCGTLNGTRTASGFGGITPRLESGGLYEAVDTLTLLRAGVGPDVGAPGGQSGLGRASP